MRTPPEGHRRSDRPDTANNDRKFHGGKLMVLAIVAIVTFAAGGIPLWEFIDAQDGTYPTTGTVVCSHLSSVTRVSA